MKKHRWIVPTSLLVTVGLVAAACGGDNKSGGAAATTAAPATTAAAAAATTAGATTTAGGAATTAAGAGAEGPVVPAAGSGKYGQDPTNKDLYVGPSGFTIDSRSARRTGTRTRASPTPRSTCSPAADVGPAGRLRLLVRRHAGVLQVHRPERRHRRAQDRPRRQGRSVPAGGRRPTSTRRWRSNKYAAFTACWARRTTWRSGTRPTTSACRSCSTAPARRSGATWRATRGPRACSSTTSPRPACGRSG